MKLAARQLVEGTHPPMYIGHRVWTDSKSGHQRTSRRWYVEYNDQGVRRAEQLKTTNKQVAIRRVHQIADRVVRGELPEPPSCTLEQLTADYIATLRGKGRAPKTIGKYTDILQRLVRHAAGLKLTLARQYTETEFWKFSEHMIGEGLGEKSRYNYLVIVKQVFRWAAQNRRLQINALASVKLEEPADVEQPVFSPLEVAGMLAAADPHERAIYSFLAYTGARFGEARDVLWEDVRLEDGAHGFVVIRRGGSDGRTKSGRSRRIPIHPELRPVLAGLNRHPDSPRVFHARPSLKHPAGDGPIDERRMLRGLKRLAISLKLQRGKAFKLHSFRHFFASMLASEQISYKYALEFMGHSSSRVLDLYYRMYDPVAEKAILAIRLPVAEPRVRDSKLTNEGRNAA